jgi:hypothetical protein
VNDATSAERRSGGPGRFETASLTAVHWIALALAALTGAIHLLLAAVYPGLALRVSFLLAGLGFFGAIGLFLLDYRRRLLYLLGVPFTGAQVVLWYVIVQPTPGTLYALDAVDKTAQILLIALLAYLYATEGTEG